MTKHFKDKEPKDQSRINIYQIDEFNFWMNQFKVSGDSLVEAVFTVGNVRYDVEQFLKVLRPFNKGEKVG